MDQKTAEYVVTHCACFYFRSASRTITQMFDRALAPAGIRSTQLVVLVLLEAKGPLSFSDLSKQLFMDQTSFSRIAKRLIDSGWVKQSVSKNDRRVRKLALTPKGDRVIDRASPYWEIAQTRVTNLVGEKEFGELRERLAKATLLFEPRNETAIWGVD